VKKGKADAQSKKKPRKVRCKVSDVEFAEFLERLEKRFAAANKKIFDRMKSGELEIHAHRSSGPEEDAKLRRVLHEKAKEIDPDKLSRKISAVLLFVKFFSDTETDENGEPIPRLFEFSKEASKEIRNVGKASQSFGEGFRSGLLLQ